MAILILQPNDGRWTLPDATTPHQVLGSSGADRVALAAGAQAELQGFRGADSVALASGSDAFTVKREGATVTLWEASTGTQLTLAAGAEPVSLQFAGETTTLRIEAGRVLLGEQAIEGDWAPVTLAPEEPAPPEPAPEGFAYTLDYTNPGDFGGYLESVDHGIRSALDYWGQLLDTHAGAELEIQINYTPQSGSALASAGGPLVPTEAWQAGYRVYEPVAAAELITGEDRNGSRLDAQINLATWDLSRWWFDPTPMARHDNAPGAGQFDFVGVMLHEFAHVLGFTTLYDYTSRLEVPYDALSVYDTQVRWNTDQSQFYFVGEQATQAFAELGGQGALPLYVQPYERGSSVSHYDGLTGSGSPQLEGLLMNPSVAAGVTLDVQALDLAVLADLGYTTRPDVLAGLNALSADAATQAAPSEAPLEAAEVLGVGLPTPDYGLV